MSAITDIKGVGPVLAKTCADRGFGSIKKISTAKAADLAAVPGIGEAKAQLMIADALALLAAVPATDGKAAVEAKKQKKKKGKKSKKAKKSKKKNKKQRKTGKKKK